MPKVKIVRRTPQAGGAFLEPGLIHNTTTNMADKLCSAGFAVPFEGKLPRGGEPSPAPGEAPQMAAERPAAGGTGAEVLDREAIIQALNDLKVTGLRKNASTVKLAELLEQAQACDE